MSVIDLPRAEAQTAGGLFSASSGHISERFIFIDYMKAIGIFLIVYGHLGIDEFERCFLWTFHVPMFFCVSGFLTRPNRFTVDMRKKASRLLLPYVYIYVISTIALSLLTLLETGKFSATEFAMILIGMFWGNPGYSHFPNAPLWFLPSLFTVEMLFGLSATRWRWLLLITPFVAAYLYTHHIVDTFMNIDLSLLGLNFFILGYLVRASGLLQRLRSAPLVFLLVFSGSLFSYVWSLANVGNLWAEGDSIPAYFTSFAGGVTGSMMIATFSMLCERCLGESRLVSFISQNTLLILGFHFLSANYAKMIVDSVIRCDPAMIEEYHLITLRNAAYTSVSILLLTPLIIAINRYCPQIGGRR